VNVPPEIFESGGRILIVDDERHNRNLLQVMLEPDGFVLELAENGAEALAMIAARAPDLILLDIMMPGMDGVQVAKLIKGNPATRNIPIIMVSALDNRDAKMLGLGAGAEDFLTKPVDRAELRVRVRNLLRLKAYGEYYDNYSQMLEGEVLSRTADLVDRSRTLEQQAMALQRNEERTDFALSAAQMGVWEIDLATNCVMWSDSMAPLYGLTPESAPKTRDEFFSLIHADDRMLVQQAASQAAQFGTPFEMEFRVIWPDGSSRWSAGRARVVLDAHGKPTRLLGIGTDISDRKSLESQLRQAQKMDAVGKLAGGLAHDFNNLLTAILGYSSCVIETLGPADERRSDMEEVVKAGQKAASLTRQLLAFSRKQPLQPTVIDVNALVMDMRALLGQLIGADIDFVTILSAEPVFVRADRAQIEQVLMNLVVNARDAMPKGGRLAVETATVTLDDSFMNDVAINPGEYVMLSVSDDGMGMDEATKQRLFEPFFTTKEQGKGTGLGLATVYGIVKQSNGYIWVHSELARGATFKVFLSSADHDAEDAPLPHIETGVPPGAETILLVEDDQAVRALTKLLLERFGYLVHDAPNPEQAEAMFDRNECHYDLLVTDVIMPGSSGPTLYQRLRAKRSDLRVLFMSGYTGDTIAHQGQLDAGMGFLQKPFTREALSQRVRSALDA
jgi:two-component system cell cycle sensor histidine kinase/response regulator CckA